MADQAIDAVAAAQRPDGYLNTFVQVLAPGREYRDLQLGPRAVLHRPPHPGRGRLAPGAGRRPAPRVAARAADSRRRGLRPGRARAGSTATPRSRWRSSSCIGRPASGATSSSPRRSSTVAATACSAPAGSERAYWQDHRARPRRGDGHRSRRPPAVPRLRRGRRRDETRRRGAARRASAPLAGHGRDADVPHRRRSAAATSDEAFGDPYELPPDRAYTETCAAIAGVDARLAAAAGDRRPATAPTSSSGRSSTASCPGCRRDGTASSTSTRSSDGRDRAASEPRRPASAQPWYRLRLLPAERDAYAGELAAAARRRPTTRGSRSSSTPPARSAPRSRAARSGSRRDRLSVGRARSRSRSWRRRTHAVVARRCASRAGPMPGSVDVGRVGDHGPAPGERLARSTRAWRAGGRRQTRPRHARPRRPRPHPRIDAIRGCLALERGPLVYADRDRGPPGRNRGRGRRPSTRRLPAPRRSPGSDLGPGVVGLAVPAATDGRGSGFDLAAVPYHAWGNRAVEAMRVWIPRPTPRAGAERDGARGRSRRPSPTRTSRSRRSGLVVLSFGNVSGVDRDAGVPGHQAQRRPVRGRCGRPTWSRSPSTTAAWWRASCARRPTRPTHRAPVPRAARHRRRRPHALARGDGVGAGRASDPVSRDDARRPLPRLRPGEPAARPGRGRRRVRVGDGARDRRDARDRGPDGRTTRRPSSCARTGRSAGGHRRRARSRRRSRSRPSPRSPPGPCWSTPRSARSRTSCSLATSIASTVPTAYYGQPARSAGAATPDGDAGDGSR